MQLKLSQRFRRLYNNFKKYFPNLKLKQMLWKVVKVTYSV